MQLLMGCETVNPVYGRTNNPWNIERTPGGSSGGEGAAVAALFAPIGIGSDIGGSVQRTIRISSDTICCQLCKNSKCC